jgi:uncharacterized iron-regulated membrane protein
MNKTSFRAAVFQIHLWAGLALGIYAFLIGITGSLLMFHEEIVHQMAPAPKVSHESPRSLEEIRTRIVASYPEWQVWSFEIPSEPGQPWSSYILGKGKSKLVYADAEGNIVGERDLANTWFGVVQRFHSNLLLPRGRLINGIAGLALTLIACTGIVLWWPAAGAWRSAFRIVRTSNWKGVVYDLHRVGGALSVAFVLLFCITGAYFTWPAIYRGIVASVFPMQEKKPAPKMSITGPRKPIDNLVAAARLAVPDGEPLRLLVPNNVKGPVRVMFRHGEEKPYPTSTVVMNGHTAEVLSLELFSANKAGDTVARYIPMLHTGNFGGLGVRIVWAVAGLAFPALFVTGFLMWCNRVLAPRLRRSRRTEQPEPALPAR